MSEKFFEKVYSVVRQIPKGKVATYGQIATLCGNSKMSRQVGWALHVNPKPIEIPCHRVVNRYGQLSGAFAFGGMDVQASLLTSEGVEVADGKVDMEKFQWKNQ